MAIQNRSIAEAVARERGRLGSFIRQRDVFIAHELDGRSFKELATQSGNNVNTLLGWKRQAVLHLRSRLQPLYDELSR